LDEKDLSEKIKNLDFSRYSAKHKEQLWKALSEKSDSRVLLEDELSIAAAGISDSEVEISQSSTRICANCGSKNVNSKGQCGDCKYRTLL